MKQKTRILKKNIHLSRLSTFAASLLFSLATTQAAFAQVNLASVPLFLKESVDPNLMFVFDDSGSMGWRYMPDNLGETQTKTGIIRAMSTKFITIRTLPIFPHISLMAAAAIQTPLIPAPR